MDNEMTIKQLIKRLIPFINGGCLNVEINVQNLDISFEAYAFEGDKLRIVLSKGASGAFEKMLNLKVFEYKFESGISHNLKIACNFVEVDEFKI